LKEIITKIEELKQNPFPENSKKMLGTENLYRLRKGNYRILYSIYKTYLVIEIVKIGHRKDVYRMN
jgi:mRNA interferase RelE/StbE